MVPAAKEPEPCKQQIVNMAIMSSPRTNLTDPGDPRPVQLRIYQLTTDVRLNNATFQQVWKDDKGILKDDLIKSEEMSIYPDTRTDIRFERDEKALVIAAVALFREPKGRSWYMTMELPPPPTKGSCGQKDEEGGSLLNPHYSVWIDGSRVDEGSDHLDDYPNPGRRRDLSLNFDDPSGAAPSTTVPSPPGAPGVSSVPSAGAPSLPGVQGAQGAPSVPNASAPSVPTATECRGGPPEMRPRKLLWTEGLFLTQHHLQQLDRYHEQLLDSRLQLVDPLSWGITEMEIDERALGLNQLKISRLQAILPDGTPIEVGDGEGDALPPRSLENVLTPQMRSLDVYVGIASESDVSPNTDLEGRPGAISRYLRDSGSVLDYNLGAGEQPVQWARKNLRLLFGEERQDAVSGIRVAQLTRTAAGVIAIRPGFIAPVRRIGASAFLHSGFVRLLEMMTAKQRSLAETRQQRTSAAVEFQASDAAKFWLLNALNSSIPPFAHMVDQRTTDPERAYIELGRLIGQLCTFAVEGDPTTIPKFNYLDLGECFGPMFQRAATLLDAVVAEKYVVVPPHQALRRPLPRQGRGPDVAALRVLRLRRHVRRRRRGHGARAPAAPRQDRLLEPDQLDPQQRPQRRQAGARVPSARRVAGEAGRPLLQARQDPRVLERHRGNGHDRALPAHRPRRHRVEAVRDRPREFALMSACPILEAIGVLSMSVQP